MKRTKGLRLMSLVLLLAMALSAFAACGDTPSGTTPSDEDSSTPPVTTSPDTPESSATDSDGVGTLLATPASCRLIGDAPVCENYTTTNGGYSIPLQQKKKVNVTFTFPSLDAAVYTDAFLGFHILYTELPYYLRTYVSGSVIVDEQTHTDVQYGSYSLRSDGEELTAGAWCWVEIPLTAFAEMKGTCTCEAGGGGRHTITNFRSNALTGIQLTFDDVARSTLSANTNALLTNVGIYTRLAAPTNAYKGDTVPAAFMLSLNLKNTAPSVTTKDYLHTTTVGKGQTASLDFSFDKADVSGRKDAFVGFLVRMSEKVPLKVGVTGVAESTLYTVPEKLAFGSDTWSWVELPISAMDGASASSLSGITVQADGASATEDVTLEIKYVGVYSYEAAKDITSIQPVPVGSDISSTYEWDHVLLGCYGFVNGMVMHPKDPNLLYAWTDVGGMYRWDPENEKWIQLMNVLGYENTDYKSVRSVALDPNDTESLYVACGGPNGGKSDILISHDRGNSWSFMNFSEKVGKNVFCSSVYVAKAVGDALVIDPNNTDIMFFGTQEDGFFRSADKGATWTKITSIPDKGEPDGGVANVYIDTRKVSGGRSTDIYVSSWGYGIYKSTDGGLTFSLIEGSPRCSGQVQVIEKNGKERLYATSLNPNWVGYYTGTSYTCDEKGSFWMYEDGKWTDLDPTKNDPNHIEYSSVNSFGSFLIDSRNPDVIIVNTAPWNVRYSYLWRSTDGGMTFEKVSQTHQASRLIQDPLNPNNAWMPYGGNIAYLTNFATVNPSAMSSKDHFVYRGTGVETLCTTELASLPGTEDAPILLIMAQDHSIRIQEELRELAPDNDSYPTFSHGGGVDFCEGDPTFVVRVGTAGRHDEGEGTVAYSKNSGRTFTGMFWDTSMRIVDCAVGAEKQENGFPIIMVYSVGRSNEAPDGAGVYRTLDGGKTWDYMVGLPTPGTRHIASHQYNNRLIASDRVNPNVFYYLGTGRTLYRTADGGNSWSEITISGSDITVGIAGRESIKCVPGKEGHVWVKGQDGVILTSADYGRTWSELSGISALMSHSGSFGFGIGKDPEGDPAVYVVGYVNGVLGCYLSDDMGKSWTKISPDSQKFFAGVVDVVGDRRVYGRVFVSTGGNGVLYAQIDK